MTLHSQEKTKQEKTKKVKFVGLTSSIACGKSLVMEALKESGIPTIDADTVVHQLYQTDTDLKAKILEHFGQALQLPNGEIDRKALGNAVFKNAEKRKLLESWIHPKTRAAIQAFYEKHLDPPLNTPLVVAEIPLLFETGKPDRFDEIWVVKATPEQQLARLIKRDGLTKQAAQERINSQIPIDKKLQLADIVINNTGSPEETVRQVKQLVAKQLQETPS